MNLESLSRANIISDSFWCYYMPIIELLYILSLKPIIKTSYLALDYMLDTGSDTLYHTVFDRKLPESYSWMTEKVNITLMVFKV